MAGSAAVRERMQWTSVIEKGLLERMADWVAARWMETRAFCRDATTAIDVFTRKREYEQR